MYFSPTKNVNDNYPYIKPIPPLTANLPRRNPDNHIESPAVARSYPDDRPSMSEPQSDTPPVGFPDDIPPTEDESPVSKRPINQPGVDKSPDGRFFPNYNSQVVHPPYERLEIIEPPLDTPPVGSTPMDESAADERPISQPGSDRPPDGTPFPGDRPSSVKPPFQRIIVRESFDPFPSYHTPLMGEYSYGRPPNTQPRFDRRRTESFERLKVGRNARNSVRGRMKQKAPKNPSDTTRMGRSHYGIPPVGKHFPNGAPSINRPRFDEPPTGRRPTSQPGFVKTPIKPIERFPAGRNARTSFESPPKSQVRNVKWREEQKRKPIRRQPTSQPGFDIHPIKHFEMFPAKRYPKNFFDVPPQKEAPNEKWREEDFQEDDDDNDRNIDATFDAVMTILRTLVQMLMAIITILGKLTVHFRIRMAILGKIILDFMEITINCVEVMLPVITMTCSKLMVGIKLMTGTFAAIILYLTATLKIVIIYILKFLVAYELIIMKWRILGFKERPHPYDTYEIQAKNKPLLHLRSIVHRDLTNLQK